MSGEVRTQGTQIWVLDTYNSPQAIREILKVMDIGNFGPKAPDIDITNFSSTAKEYLVGLADNGEVALQLNFKPTDTVHQFLNGRAGTATTLQFCIGLADGTTSPTQAANVFVAPTSRTSFIFTASVKSFEPGIKKDDAVRVNCSLRITGAITSTYHA